MSIRGELPAYPDPHLQPTLSVPAAGWYLGLGRAQAYAAASRGEIPTLRVGRRLLVPTAILARRLGLLTDDASSTTGPAASEAGQ